VLVWLCKNGGTDPDAVFLGGGQTRVVVVQISPPHEEAIIVRGINIYTASCTTDLSSLGYWVDRLGNDVTNNMQQGRHATAMRPVVKLHRPHIITDVALVFDNNIFGRGLVFFYVLY